MPNNLALAGSNPGKQTKRSAMWNARFWDGLYTQKGALRDVAPRQEEKFYGARGDSLIDGSNVEITSKLTLARRFGNSIWNSNEWSNIDSFYEFRLFN